MTEKSDNKKVKEGFLSVFLVVKALTVYSVAILVEPAVFRSIGADISREDPVTISGSSVSARSASGPVSSTIVLLSLTVTV